MSASTRGLATRAAEMRSTFDDSFALPVSIDSAVEHDLLAIRVGTERCAIRLSEITGLFVDRKITHVPCGGAPLLGIAGFRGALVPVYSLQILLGHCGTFVPRWLAIVAAAPVALAFDVFEGHLRVPGEAILPQHTHARMPGYAPEFISTDGVVRPVLHLPCIIGVLGTTEMADAATKRSETL